MQFRVWQSVVEAYDYCWRERRAVVKFGWLPLLVTVIGAIGLQIEAGKGGQPSIWLMILAVMQAIVYLPVTVTWYRMVVLGEAEAAQRPAFTLGRLELRMLGWQLLLVLLMFVGGFVGSFVISFVVGFLKAAGLTMAANAIALIFGAALIGAIFVTAMRLALVLVLVALDQPVSLKMSWQMTKGLAMRLLAAIILIAAMAIVVLMFVYLIAFPIGAVVAMATGMTVSQVVPYVAAVGANAVSLVMYLAVATLFAMLYRMLTHGARPAVILENPS